MKRTRQKPAREEAVSQLRQRIVAREWHPGDQLPARHELASQLGVSYVTAQRTVEILKDEGFLISRAPEGTFVHETPPHLCQIGLIFPNTTEVPKEDSYYYRSLRAASESLSSSTPYSFHNHYFIDWHRDRKYFEQLVADTQRYLYAGLIFVHNPAAIRYSPYWNQLQVPKTTITSAPGSLDIPCVVLDYQAWSNQAATILKSRGCQRVAVIGKTYPEGLRLTMQELLANHGLQCSDCDFYAVSPEGAANVAHLLLRQSPDGRPDGLLIIDDHLAQPVAAGLQAAFAPAPEVISLINLPTHGPLMPGFTYLGFDQKKVLQACLDLLGDAWQMTRPPAMKPVPPELICTTEV